MRSGLRAADRVVDRPGLILRSGDAAARARPWPGDVTTAHLVAVDQGRPPPAEVITAWCEELAAAGFAVVRTGAVGPSALYGYLNSGFAVRQELALLNHDLRSIPPSPPARLRRAARDEVRALASIDREAFGPLWGMDATGVVDACEATPVHRVRVADAAGRHPAAFAIAGRAARSGFLQRLAVAPDAQGHGLGRALTVDALRWARRSRCGGLLVNTHVDNDAALGLYRGLGFVELAYRLSVLERRLG